MKPKYSIKNRYMICGDYNMSSSTDDYKKSSKSIKSSLIKWGLILCLLVFACIKNRKFMGEAMEYLMDTSPTAIILCLILGNMYFVLEGAIISKMTASESTPLTLWNGICCTYMCAFYRLATLGSGNGIAQIYYYSTKGIDADRATGMTITQYTFQKITIGIFGTVSFILLFLTGDRDILQYSGYMLAGVFVISVICLALFLIAVSKKISTFVMMLGYRLFKPGTKLHARLSDAQNAIDNLQNQGLKLWKNKSLFFHVAALNIIKLACWYAIPGVFFHSDYGVNVLFCLALMAVVNMLGCVMLAPSGVGTLDFVFAIFFGAIIPDDNAVAAAIVIYRFFTWVMPFIIGLIPALLLNRKK
jgi:hypothetical protein